MWIKNDEDTEAGIIKEIKELPLISREKSWMHLSQPERENADRVMIGYQAPVVFEGSRSPMSHGVAPTRRVSGRHSSISQRFTEF